MNEGRFPCLEERIKRRTKLEDVYGKTFAVKNQSKNNNNQEPNNDRKFTNPAKQKGREKLNPTSSRPMRNYTRPPQLGLRKAESAKRSQRS